MEVVWVLIVIALLALIFWVATRSRVQPLEREVKEEGGVCRSEAGRSSEVSAIPTGHAESPHSKTHQRIRDALACGRLSRDQAVRILDRAHDLGLPEDLCEALSLFVRQGADSGFSRCAVCGAPAIPGDNMCFAHHAR